MYEIVPVIVFLCAVIFLVWCVHKREIGKINNDIEAEDYNSRKKIKEPTDTNTYNIICPFCYNEFSPNDVRFCFHFDSAEGNTEIYLSANKDSEETKEFCRKNNIYIKFNYDANYKIPKVMKLYNRDSNELIKESPIRVCKNKSCNKQLSVYAGTYAVDNGLFLIGLRGSGKTVFITSAIKRLGEILPRYYDSMFNAYNKDVDDEYLKEYYKIIFESKELPAATIHEAQLTYEVINRNRKKNKVVGITFSDIKGEISDDPQKVLLDSRGIAHSNYYLLTIDINNVLENIGEKNKNEAIIKNVLSLATQSGRESKYLAVVLTKSDELVGLDEKDIFSRDSLIYTDINYKDNEAFIKERKSINSDLRQYLKEKYISIVLAAETAFEPEHVNYFAVSAIGQKPEMGKLNADIMPRRVEEPIIWLLIKSGCLLV